ncbi:MAG: hypothetical protein ACRYGR_03145 [Janthinobacterium lividum]
MNLKKYIKLLLTTSSFIFISGKVISSDNNVNQQLLQPNQYISDYYKTHLLPAIQRYFSNNNRNLGPLWYSYDDLEASEFARNMGENFYNPGLLLATAGFDPNILNGLPEFDVDLINNPVANNQVIANENNFDIEDLSIETLKEILDVMGVVLEEEDRDDIEFLRATIISLQENELNNERIETARVQAERIAALEARRLEEAQRLDEDRRAETARRFQADRAAVEVNPVMWANMTKAQRILVIAEKIFESPNSNETFGIPVAVNKRIELKNIFEALMAENYINTNAVLLPNAEPANFRMHFFPVSNILRKAINIQKYEVDYGMTRQEAKDFDVFNSLYHTKFANFPLDTGKQIIFYRALKNNFGDMSWVDLTKILTPILEKSLPLDYDQWPNFAVNPASNFDDFIHDIVRPCVTALIGNADIEAAAEAYVDRLLLNIQTNLKHKINHKINTFQDDNNTYIGNQLRIHGAQNPLEDVQYPIDVAEDYEGNVLARHLLGNVQDHRFFNRLINETVTFEEWTNGISDKLLILEDEKKDTANSRQMINYSYLCRDPFLSLLRLPDERLVPLTNTYLNHNNEVQNLKDLVLGLVPHADRILDQEFNDSFDYGGFALGGDNALNKATVIRLKRLFDCVKDNHNGTIAEKERKVANIIYAFGTENSGRCIDGKRDRITELEREYVYVANGLNANADLDTTIGLNLAKLFTDDRMNKLRTAINDLYPDEGEERTYAWSRSHKAIHLGFGLSGKYEDLLFGRYHEEGINPVEFVNAYFKGGQVRGKESNIIYHMQAFTIDTMADIVLQEIQNVMGGLFDDNTLDHMIKSNLDMRRAYSEFQDNGGDLNFENRYFKNGLQDDGEPVVQRGAIKKEAIFEVLKTYNYMYSRNDDNSIWE